MSMNNKWTYNISVAISDGQEFQIRPLAKVENGFVTLIPTSIETLDTLNESICRDIHAMLTDPRLSAGNMKEPKFYAVSEMQAVMFHVLRWRSCTGFVLLQQSPRGNSLVCYFADHPFHSSASFNTSSSGTFSSHPDFENKLWALYKEWLTVYLPLANNRNKVYNLLIGVLLGQEPTMTARNYRFGV